MPKVSVIIPTYNREEYISETIESVLGQSFKDFEIIVVNDGSIDNTIKKLERFESKIKLINQSNSERAVSRNNGVKNSNGKYIAFLDSDDLWFKNKLEKQVEILDDKKDIILTYGQSLRINEKSEKTKTVKRQKEGFSGKVFEQLLSRNFISSPTPVIKREYFEKTSGFSTKYIPYEDWEFWIRFSLLGNFYFIKEPLAYYRIHKEQSVQLVSAEKIEKVTTLLLEDSFKLTNNLSENVKRKSLGLANLRFCYWYLLANQINIAKEKIATAINQYPNFLLDPRWYGLRFLCEAPFLKGKLVFDLERYH